MAGAATSAAAVLAVILASAALAKGATARRRERTADAFAALGLPVPELLAVAVGVTELVVAGALVIRPAAGGVAAVVLLAAFTAVVVRGVIKGEQAGCGCFGSRNHGPVGPGDVVRNAMLGALGVLATATSHPVPPSFGQAGLVVFAAAAGWAALATARRWVWR